MSVFRGSSGLGIAQPAWRQYGEDLKVTLKGDQGDDGDKGLKGDKGNKGDDGLKGLKGEQGLKGEDGRVGIKGGQGADGDTGDAGAKGDKGNRGDDGDRGIDGAFGIKGEPGDKGNKGALGDDGISYGKGEKGDFCISEKGEQGEPGDKGLKGIRGVDAEPAAPGDQGEKGEKGNAGVKGVKGEMGDQGEQGVKGQPSSATGEKGEKGEQGDKGLPGDPSTEEGDKGCKGLPGAKGLPGVSTGPCCGFIPAATDNTPFHYITISVQSENSIFPQSIDARPDNRTEQLVQVCDIDENTIAVTMCGSLNVDLRRSQQFTMPNSALMDIYINLETLSGVCGIPVISRDTTNLQSIILSQFAVNVNSVELNPSPRAYLGSGCRFDMSYRTQSPFTVGVFAHATVSLISAPGANPGTGLPIPMPKTLCIDYTMCFKLLKNVQYITRTFDNSKREDPNIDTITYIVADDPDLPSGAKLISYQIYAIGGGGGGANGLNNINTQEGAKNGAGGGGAAAGFLSLVYTNPQIGDAISMNYCPIANSQTNGATLTVSINATPIIQANGGSKGQIPGTNSGGAATNGSIAQVLSPIYVTNVVSIRGGEGAAGADGQNDTPMSTGAGGDGGYPIFYDTNTNMVVSGLGGAGGPLNMTGSPGIDPGSGGGGGGWPTTSNSFIVGGSGGPARTTITIAYLV